MNTLIRVLFCWGCLAAVACTPSGGVDNGGEPEPQTTTPTRARGKWVYGSSFSATDFWNYNGSYSGKAFEQGMLFDFGTNGKYEVYTINSATTYSCRTESYAFTAGTVTFDEGAGSFSIRPVRGTMRGYYACAPSKNFKRDAQPNELKPKTYYYAIRKNSRGETVMTVSSTPNLNDGMDMTAL
ncbi:hypothetical protein [Rudanella lutea]|uniref:hypothetical protein n=1 Tax=Rudanella lutea TaxID=451374 RepID=UPI0012F82C5E|nr:hypothetical protein [Rudanella lutea]